MRFTFAFASATIYSIYFSLWCLNSSNFRSKAFCLEKDNAWSDSSFKHFC
jgi:hypothetical protein